MYSWPVWNSEVSSALLLKQGSSKAQARLILPQYPKDWDHSCTSQCLTANILRITSKVLVSLSNRTIVRKAYHLSLASSELSLSEFRNHQSMPSTLQGGDITAELGTVMGSVTPAWETVAGTL